MTSVTPPATVQSLTAADVTALVQAAAQAADPNTMVIAVVDRAGNVLGVYRKPSAPTLATGNFSAQVDVNELAVSLARTGAFFSNDQAPLSSRTVRFISGIHFPPGIANTPNAPLYGIENTNRGCTLSTNFIAGQSVPPARSISGATTGLGIATGKVDVNDSDPNAVNPGGVPLFRNGSLVGGIGVAGVAPDVAEYAAYRGGNFKWIWPHARRARRCIHWRRCSAVRESNDSAGRYRAQAVSREASLWVHRRARARRRKACWSRPQRARSEVLPRPT